MRGTFFFLNSQFPIPNTDITISVAICASEWSQRQQLSDQINQTLMIDLMSTGALLINMQIQWGLAYYL
ncbi:MAG: hypothetical protein F6K31_12480 [Symploca sp. SIO2G7]|nr:hypothetical protein [Symploca sp. SIO2G7]